jgi:hypothetical protein
MTDLARTGYTTPSARAFYERFVPAVQALPGVRAVAFAGPAPFRGVNPRTISTADDDARTQLVSCRAVSPGFFDMVGVHLLGGRLFTETEARIPERVMPVIVSSSFVERHLAGGPGVGRRIRIGGHDRAEIIGVVADTVSVRPGERDQPVVYQPLYMATVGSMVPLVQIDSGATAVGELIRARVQMLDGRLTARPESVAAAIAGDAAEYSAVIRLTAIPATLAFILSERQSLPLRAEAVQRAGGVPDRWDVRFKRCDAPLLSVLQAIRHVMRGSDS